MMDASIPFAELWIEPLREETTSEPIFAHWWEGWRTRLARRELRPTRRVTRLVAALPRAKAEPQGDGKYTAEWTVPKAGERRQITRIRAVGPAGAMLMENDLIVPRPISSGDVITVTFQAQLWS